MNTSLKFIALLLASGLPAAFGAEFTGIPLPAVLDPLRLFVMLIVSLILLVLQSDYGIERSPLGRFTIDAARVADRTVTKADHPLAA